MINVKRVYDLPSREDGFRILVDRLWPRGLSKEKAKVDLWLKEIAPSDNLRKWYGHEPNKWIEFKRRYFEELEKKEDLVQVILEKVKKRTTFLFGSKEKKLNNAVALKEYIEKKI